MKKRPNILSIGGFDPSGGAGVLADVKTIEALKGVGMAVQTANTVQTEDLFLSVNWFSSDEIIIQLKALLNRYVFDGVKIGLIHDFLFLNKFIPLLRENNPSVIIVWDPVLSASAGFKFDQDLSVLSQVLSKVDYITPNWNEMRKLSKAETAQLGGELLSAYTKVYLKGGHHETNPGKDFLFDNENVKSFNPKPGPYSEKHGSGCVFASALVVNLCKGYPEQKAILRAKRYIEQFLKSDASKLGRHNG